MTQEILIQKLDSLLEKVNEVKQDTKEFKQEIKQETKDFRQEITADIKTIKTDISAIKASQASLVTSVGWIKVLFGGASGLIILLVGTLIKLALDVLAIAK